MPPDATEQGEMPTFPGFEFPVERGKVREFARAVGSTHPEYLDDPRPVIPPTWLVTTAHWNPSTTHDVDVLEAVGFDIERLLHGGQSFTFVGEPPRAGAVLRSEMRIDRTYEKEGRRGGTMRFAELVIAYRDESGDLVAEGHTTIIETARPPRTEP
jgi:hypothetical protein